LEENSQYRGAGGKEDYTAFAICYEFVWAKPGGVSIFTPGTSVDQDLSPPSRPCIDNFENPSLSF